MQNFKFPPGALMTSPMHTKSSSAKTGQQAFK